MKKLINDPDAYVDEMLAGLCAAHPELTRIGATNRVVVPSAAIKGDRVGIVSGGGSGHLPLFTGYVGQGLLDACAIGDVFAGPSVDSCVEAIRSADRGRGVLRLYGNYGGDRMNFDLAGELLEAEGIRTTTVLGTDDIASAAPDESAKRRGVAGIIYAYKSAGAMAETGADLGAVTETAREAVDRVRTIGCALSSCRLPGVTQSTFSIGSDEVEMGMGIHGEPGIWRDKMKPADAITDEMIGRLLAERVDRATGRVSILVNSLGATPLEELYIVYRRAKEGLEHSGFQIVRPLVGHWATSMEMAGISISIFHLSDALEQLLTAPCSSPFWRA